LSIAEQRAVGFIPAWSLASLHSVFCKEKSTGGRETVKESKGGKGSACDKVTRSTARMEKEFSDGVKEASRGALWQRCAGKNMLTKTRVVYRGSSSLVPNL